MTNKEGMEFSARKPSPKAKAKLKSTKSVPALSLGSIPRFSFRSSNGKKKECSTSSGGSSSSSVQTALCTLSTSNQACVMNTTTTPSPKPTPYLEPIKSRATGKQVGGGTRAALIPPPKIVADRRARGDETNCKVVTRTQSERTSAVLSRQRARRRELAYMIVDLQTGRPTYTSKSLDDLQKLRQPAPESDSHQLPRRSNTMSVPCGQKPIPAPRPRVRRANTLTKDPATEPRGVTNGVETDHSTGPVPTALTPPPNTRPVPAPRLRKTISKTASLPPPSQLKDLVERDPPIRNKEALRENSPPKQAPVKGRPVRPPPPNPKALQRMKTKSLTGFPENGSGPELASGSDTDVTHSRSLETVAEASFEGSIEAITATKPPIETGPPPSRPPPRAMRSLTLSPLASHSKSTSVLEQKTQNLPYVENIYEEIDTSIPIPPPRNKKNKERGRSRTSSFSPTKPPRGIAPAPPKSDPVPRRRRAPPPPPISIPSSLTTSSLQSSVNQRDSSLSIMKQAEPGSIGEHTLVDEPGHEYQDISPTDSSVVSDPLRYEYVASVVGVCVTEDEPDVGGVEEYVDMRPLSAWDDSGEVNPPVMEEEEEDRDSYVEMDSAGVEGEEEPTYVEMDPHSYIPPPSLYYASKDLLAQRPDLQVDHKKKKKKSTRK